MVCESLGEASGCLSDSLRFFGAPGGGRLAGKRRKGAGDKATAASPPRRQFAALPFRNDGGLRVLLVSSRETRRWVLPKGWPIKGMKPHSVAALEALEEAGLLGKISKRAIGAYHYIKHMPNGAALACKVEVFPFRVEKQRKNWPERDQRMTGWFDPGEAAQLVDEPELSDLLRLFAPSVETPAGEAGVSTESALR